MSDALSVFFTSILADATLRPAFQELCRLGHVQAEGRRVRFVPYERKRGQIEVTPVVSPKYEPIPAEDWGDLTLNNWHGEWRLEGARRWSDPEPAYEPKEWHFVRFRPGDDLERQPIFSRLKRRTGSKAAKRHAVVDYIDRHYPNGIPPDCKLDAICSDFKRESGLSISNRTLRRALGRK